MSDDYDKYMEDSTQSNRRTVGLILASIVVVVALVFVLQNTEDTSVDFLFLSTQAPLYVVIIISMILGALLATIAMAVRRRRKRREIRSPD